jgi:hypothetical protein
LVPWVETCWTLPTSPLDMGGRRAMLSTEGGQRINVMGEMIHELGDGFETPATLRTDTCGDWRASIFHVPVICQLCGAGTAGGNFCGRQFPSGGFAEEFGLLP